MKLLVIADDFTGALDTGVKFMSCSTVVSILFNLNQDIPLEQSVLIYNAETRHKTPEEAQKIIQDIVKWAFLNGVTHIYKKTDSALRGNIGIELSTLLMEWNSGPLVFAPAYPALNRYTRNGIQYIGELPVAESAFGLDMIDPVHHSRVADVIYETATPLIQETCGNHIDSISTKEKRIIICDANTESDLENIASWAENSHITCFAGCAGLAKALAARMCVNEKEYDKVPTKPLLLAVCGSVNPITVEQVLTAEKAGVPRARLSKKKMLVSYDGSDSVSDSNLMQWIEECKINGALIIDVENDSDTGKDIIPVEIGMKIANYLATITKRMLDLGLNPTLFCTGGDTFLAIVNKLGVKKISLDKEMYPGVVLTKVMYNGNILNIISKSGGFGNKNLLLDIRKSIQEK